MSLYKEQTGSGWGRGKSRKWVKNQLQRFLRRLARRNPENAPRKNREVYQGYD